MKKIKLLFTIAAAFLGCVLASAQNIQVTGTITDATTGEGVPFAAIMVKGTSNGVASDAEGAYSINAGAHSTLIFSAVGYTTQEINVEDRRSIDVLLQPDRQFLEGTVVVGYGSAKKVSSLVGSVQTVNSETLKNAPSSSALDQLQGQVAGLSVLSYSGVAGDNAVSMTLHGVGSLGASSTPLYVIDGIPSSSRAIMAMNPNDIESISILKDAAATSIYGSRAANGVVYVITKAGSYNERANVTVRSQYGMSTLANTAFYENMMTGDELVDFWIRSGIHSEEWVKSNFLDKGYNNNTQWYKIFMDMVNPQYQNDITVQGGGSKVAYMMSASQYHQKGFTPGNYYDRYTVRSNVQAHPLNWLKVGLNLNLSLDKTQQNPNWGSAQNGMSNYTSGGLSYLLNPLYPAYDENGELYAERFPMGTMNPHYYMENHIDRYDRYGANGNVFVEIEPVKNLKFVSRSGLDGYIRVNDWQYYPSYTQKWGGTPERGLSTALEYSATITNTAEYSMEINPNNRFSVLVGQEGVSNDYLYFAAYGYNFKDDRMMMLGQVSDPADRRISESQTQSKFLSFFGHADYSLFDRYYFDVAVRNDAVSRFGADVRNAQFWSAGLRWNAKKESFLQHVDAINSLDAKLSYGTQGNASIGDYSSLGLIGSSGAYQGVSGSAVTQPANSFLTWEKQALLTVGISGRAFNVLDFELEYYNRRTSSMLMDVPNPYTAGFTSVTQNVGTLQNAGFDVTLGVDILRSRDYFFRINTTFNYNQQKVTELFDGRQRWEIANTGVAYVVGQPVMFYYPLYAGIDPADGKPMWYLPGDNKDVTTTNNGTTKSFDEAALTQNTGKSRYAPMNGGFSLSGGWKGLSLQADFTYVIGKNLISNDGYFYGNPYNFNTMNSSKAVNDFWTPTHTDAKWPNWADGAVMQFDSHLLEDATFMRLKNLQAAYSLPKSLLGWSNGVVKELKITFTGRNLLTFTKYTGIDPEINSNLSYGVAGNSKQILGGIELTF